MALNGTITLISNAKGGRVTKPQVAKGTTLQALLASEYGVDKVDPEQFQFSVNGANVDDSRKLKDGDIVVISPKTVKGN